MQRYPFLRFATTVLRVVGWIVLVVGVIGSIVLGITMGNTPAGEAATGVAGALLGVFVAIGGSYWGDNCLILGLAILACNQGAFLLAYPGGREHQRHG